MLYMVHILSSFEPRHFFPWCLGKVVLRDCAHLPAKREDPYQSLPQACFSISVISCCRVLIVVSSLYSIDFYVLEDVALMS